MGRARFWFAVFLGAALHLCATGARAQDPGSLLREAAGLVESGRLREAIALQERALAALEKTSPSTLELARAANNLGTMYDEVGQLDRAEDLLLRALELKRKLRGPDDPDVARTEENLAGVFDRQGNYRRSEPLHHDALRIMKKALGEDHPDVGICLNNLGHFYQLKREYDQAAPLLEKALAIFRKKFGAEHPNVATALFNLAELASERGDLGRSEDLYRQTIAMREKMLGPEHPDVAAALLELAGIYVRKKEFDRAEATLTRALGMIRKSRDANDLDVATILQGLSWTREAKGDVAGAVKAAQEANDARERDISRVLSRGTETELADTLGRFLGPTDATVSLHQRSAPRDPTAARTALDAILRYKGRVLDALREWTVLRSSADPADRALLDRLLSTRSRLATLLYAEDGVGTLEQRLAEAPLVAELDRAELAVKNGSSRLSEPPAPIAIAALQAAIPEGAALVEIAAYAPFDVRASDPAKAWSKLRYAAYVVGHGGDVRSADLGETTAIDDASVALRRALADPKSTNVRALSRALDQRVMEPIAPLLGGVTHVLLSPDGQLGIVPFGAMTAPDGRYRLETLDFTYLASGRDLLRATKSAAPKSGDIVFAAPDFGESSRPPAPPPDVVSLGPQAAPDPRRLRDVEPWGIGRLRFGPLPGTAAEGEAVGRVLTSPKVMTGAAATEAALKAVRGPRILHVATHGFFLAGDPAPSAATRGLSLEAGPPAPTSTESGSEKKRRKGFTSLLRAGIALAGANARKSGDEDGLLSAYEASGLDLGGTKLVVLSACETGLGDATVGDSVHGFRRALSMAGAETLVMSLWKVDDDATRDLMVSYYRKLGKGGGRSGALREAELEILADPKRSHPFYWAAFTTSGSWTGLEGGAVPPPARVPAVKAPPGGAHGCGCSVPGGGSEPSVWIVALVLAVTARSARTSSRRRPS